MRRAPTVGRVVRRAGRRATWLSLVCLVVAVAAAGVPAAGQEAGAKGQGTEDRDWVEGREEPPESMSPAQYQVAVSPATVPMRDGAMLTARLYLPVRPAGEEPGPCVVMADGYGPPSFVGVFRTPGEFSDLASRGYATAHVFMRTVGVPAGEALYYRYVEDGYDIVEWMAKQSWCDGNVGMFGSSLVGLGQWLAAKDGPPHLRAIVPDVACGNCYEHLWYLGGMLLGPGRDGRTPPLAPYDEYSAAAAHRDYDDWWSQRTTTSDDHAAIAKRGVAVMATGGWEDYITPGNVQTYEEFAAAGGEGKLILCPQAHSFCRSALAGPYDYGVHRVLWYDRHLKGIDHEDRGSALIYVHGPDQWRHEQAWPIPDTRSVRLYLRAAESGSIDSLADGSLSAVPPADDEANMTYPYSPESGPFLPTMRSSGTGMTDADVRPYEQATVTWTTGELEAPTEVTGSLRLSFWASAAAEDTDFVVALTDVAPDGSSTLVSSGYLNASRHPLRSEPRPLTPGEIRRYDLRIWPNSYVFDAGHRLRLSIAGGSQATPEQSGVQGPGLNPNPATVTVHQDAAHPSFVEVPVIGTAVLPTESH